MLHPVSRTKTWRVPTSPPSPWMAENTSVTKTGSSSPVPGYRLVSGVTVAIGVTASLQGGVDHADFGEATGPEGTGVAVPARTVAAAVARPGEVEGGAVLEAGAHDPRLGRLDEWGHDLDGVDLRRRASARWPPPGGRRR